MNTLLCNILLYTKDRILLTSVCPLVVGWDQCHHKLRTKSPWARLCASEELFDARCSFDITSSLREVMLRTVQPQGVEKYLARGNSMFKLARVILLNGVYHFES